MENSGQSVGLFFHYLVKYVFEMHIEISRIKKNVIFAGYIENYKQLNKVK